MNRLKSYVTVAIAFALVGCSRGTSSTDDSEASLLSKVSQDQQEASFEWTKAINPRAFSFPEDHGSHNDFRIEWWYYTGNLTSENGHRLGYQLTFFRTGIQRETENSSRWVAHDIYLAHFAVSDIANQKHYSAQQSRRAGIDAAGAETGKLKVWNGDWQVYEQDGVHHLAARQDKFAIDLELDTGKGIVLQGQEGLSKKGAAEGNASYYYSMTRMPTQGTITVGDSIHKVEGNSWMDHEFSTSFLEEGQRGWDWFSIQLDNETELMLYQMRRSDESSDPFSSGSVIYQDGTRTELTATDFCLTPGRIWRSPSTGANYPMEWVLEIKSLGIELQVEATFDEQEMTTEATTGIAYWEGAIDVKGVSEGIPIRGQGYLELTGYTDTELGTMIDDN